MRTGLILVSLAVLATSPAFGEEEKVVGTTTHTLACRPQAVKAAMKIAWRAAYADYKKAKEAQKKDPTKEATLFQPTFSEFDLEDSSEDTLFLSINEKEECLTSYRVEIVPNEKKCRAFAKKVDVDCG